MYDKKHIWKQIMYVQIIESHNNQTKFWNHKILKHFYDFEICKISNHRISMAEKKIGEGWKENLEKLFLTSLIVVRIPPKNHRGPYF